MPSFDAPANGAYATVINMPGFGGTAFVVPPGCGTRFAVGPISFRLPGANLPLEIGRVTAIVGDTLTITRAVETDHGANPFPLNVQAGWEIFQGVTAKTITDLQNAFGAIHQMGLLIDRPTPSAATSGTVYFATDSEQLFLSNGATWTQIGIGGGANLVVTLVDGADVAQGTTTDTSSTPTVIGLLKKLSGLLPAALVGGRLSVDGSGVTQPVSGAVSVSNLPGTQSVTGTFWQPTQPVSGTVAVSNLPGTQPVSGTVATTAADGALANIGAAGNTASSTTVLGYLLKLIAAFPTSLGANGGLKIEGIAGGVAQPVSGTVAVSNLPASQAVTSVDGGLSNIGAAANTAASTTVMGYLLKLIAQLPAALGANGGLKIEGVASGTVVPTSVSNFPATQPVSASALPLPTGASTETSLAAVLATAGATSGAAVITDANGTMQQYLRGLVKLLITSGTIVLGAGTNAIGKLSANANVNIGVVGGTTVAVTDVFTRPADTTAYALGDAVSATVSDTGTTVLRGLTVAGANGGTGYITKIRLWTDQATCVAAMRLQLFTVAAPTTAIPGDNVAMILSYGNFAQRIGSVDLSAFSSEAGTNTAAHATDVTTRLAFQCDPADTKLYYRLSTQTAFTPANAQSFSLELVAERNGT